MDGQRGMSVDNDRAASELRRALGEAKNKRESERFLWACIVAALVIAAVIAPIGTHDLTRRALRQQAIDIGVARRVVDRDGTVRFEWIKPKGD